MSTIQQFLRIDTLIKIAASGKKIVMPQNMLALLASMDATGYVVQQGTCRFCTLRYIRTRSFTLTTLPFPCSRARG